MRFIIAPEFHEQMLQQDFHSPDCFVRNGEYLHHLYIDGVKYVIVPALLQCLEEAQKKNDVDAIRHLKLHKHHYDALHADAMRRGGLEGVTLLGDPPPDDEEAVPKITNPYVPRVPGKWEDLGLPLPFVFESVLRTIYNRGQLTGGELANALCVPFVALSPILPAMRKQTLIDIVGQRGSSGDAAFIYEIKPPKGTAAVQDALAKTSYVGPMPVPFEDYVESILAQSVKKMVVTRRSIQKAFEDLIISEAVFSEIGPAINSAASVFFFGFPGNGKTSIAERVTRLMGDAIFIPHAVEANGQIIKVFDPILHAPVEDEPVGDGIESVLRKGATSDQRFIKVRRPTIVVGGELTMPMLDLKYNDIGKFYEAPLQMKANGGIFMIDDFGRQQLRAMDLLNRWIVPLEKRYDYLTTVAGTKVEVPFDQLLIFSTNLDPTQLADEAFLRRIKYKIEIRDPDEAQYRQIWELVCKNRRVDFDPEGIDYLIEKWYKPTRRPFRMCQPRDILDQMISMAKYNMERVNFSPDLIDAACATYFISGEKREFGAKVKLDEMLEQDLKNQAHSLGFELAGIAPATPADGFERLQEWLQRGYAGEMAYMHRGAEARKDPSSILADVRSVVMVGLSYASPDAPEPTAPVAGAGPDDSVPGSSPAARIARYARGADYHSVLWKKLDCLLEWLQQQVPGCRGRGVVDTAPLLERDFARRAGLGWIGKNTLLINKYRGSFLYLGALLVDVALQPDPPHRANHCGACTACLDACPTQAFAGPGWLDARRCISYLTIELRSSVPEELRTGLGSWLFGCDVCQEVCPWNEKRRITAPSRLDAADPVELLGLSDDEYRRRFRGTAMLRTKRRGLLRNAALVLGNVGGAEALPALQTSLEDPEPLIREAASWAIARILGRLAAAAPAPEDFAVAKTQATL